ncbi:ABC transporter ATP-binding protein [Alloscardovia criceti]|uniref:ABC transporter ATP-binding protein n=1 Tax=Alloscardovia criceti TaxID=356828 RepID=UPI00037DB7CC|nr:ABC transporter ATP-binding protein [Alloscardovia criceti]
MTQEQTQAYNQSQARTEAKSREYAIDARNIVKRFGDVTALSNFSLQVETGTIFGLIGPNGAGKTTFMRTLLDFLRPTSGEVSVLGHNVRTASATLRTQIGYLPGELRLDPNVSGHSLINYWAGLSKHPRQARKYARSLAKEFDIDLKRRVGTLSKGNKQKIGIIQAFMHSPELLILDEPTSGLDPVLQQNFLNLVLRANRDGATVLLSSHILSELEHIADRAAVMYKGRLVREATIAQLRESTRRHLSARLMGAEIGNVRIALASAGLKVAASPAEDSVMIEGDVEGQANQIIHALSQFDVRDLLISEPSLEESVLHFYEAQEARK